MGNHGAAGVSQNAGVLVVLAITEFSSSWVCLHNHMSMNVLMIYAILTFSWMHVITLVDISLDLDPRHCIILYFLTSYLNNWDTWIFFQYYFAWNIDYCLWIVICFSHVIIWMNPMMKNMCVMVLNDWKLRLKHLYLFFRWVRRCGRGLLYFQLWRCTESSCK